MFALMLSYGAGTGTFPSLAALPTNTRREHPRPQYCGPLESEIAFLGGVSRLDAWFCR